ncbi:hypothetical protein [Marinimicrobium alkaliphilum]|uniref:hypothetical protein n=1 Tax=Marinimicrobium alkaliphilum TaxID=2202654 RepID=UPI000DB91A53|nr:hypothetical protein [Marinimicrobium alkaliphilum]
MSKALAKKKMGEQLEIVLGVVSGVATAALLSVVAALFKHVILPWYQELRYEGVDLEGVWEFKEKTDSAETIVKLDIKQSAHSLKGTGSVNIDRSDGENNFFGFVVSGFVWEGYVTLNLKSSNRKIVAFSTMLLKVTNGGSRLKGTFAGRHHREDEVRSMGIELSRTHG